MTVISKPGVRDEGSAALPARRLFTVDEYYRMAEAGILRRDDRVELLEGEIFRMASIGSRHARCVGFLTEWFMDHLPREQVMVRSQSPVRLNDRSEPEPDLALLKRRSNQYDDSLPGPADVLLLVEVSHTTLRFDRETKLPIYAAAAIQEVWIVDLEGRRVEVFRQPEGRDYRETVTLTDEHMLSPGAFPDLSLPVKQLLGPG